MWSGVDWGEGGERVEGWTVKSRHFVLTDNDQNISLYHPVTLLSLYCHNVIVKCLSTQ